MIFFTLYDEDTKDFSQTYSGTASPLVLGSLESSLQLTKLHCFSKSILDKDDLVLCKKLKHSWHEGMCSSSRQSLPPGQPCPGSPARHLSRFSTTQLPHSLAAKQSLAPSCSAQLPRSTRPSWCWTAVGISRERLGCYRLQSHNGEIKDGSLEQAGCKGLFRNVVRMLSSPSGH